MKPQTAAHTPTPWKVLPGTYNGDYKIVMDDKRWSNPHQGYVMTCGHAQQSNAAFIVRACNAYEKDQEIKRELISFLRAEHAAHVECDMGEMSFKHEKKPCDVCEALAKAEGK